MRGEGGESEGRERGKWLITMHSQKISTAKQLNVSLCKSPMIS